MATVYTHMAMARRIVSFGNQRIGELEVVIQQAQAEIEMWTNLVKEQGLCHACKGETKLRHQIAQDESIMETCFACNGSGKESK